jgi:Flp pilus assembly pilin Flp
MGFIARIGQWKSAVQRFDEDEAGLNALEVVMIVAIAAVILGLVVKFASGDFWPKVKQKVLELLGG